jgi:hypothetical protein
MRLESIARLCAACILGDKKKSALGWLIFYFQRSHNHNTHIYVVDAVAHFQGGNARNNNRASVKLDNAFVH